MILYIKHTNENQTLSVNRFDLINDLCSASVRHNVLVLCSLCQDLLAVGYGEFDSSDLKPGLVCCWSLKNPTV